MHEIKQKKEITLLINKIHKILNAKKMIINMKTKLFL